MSPANILRSFRFFDWPLVSALAVILAFSFLAITSIAMSTDPPAFSLLMKQGIGLGIGFILIIVLSAINYRFFRAASNWFYLLGVLLLVLVLFFGRTINGTTGWFIIGGWSMQPAEFVKIIAIFFLARYFTDYGRALHQWRYLFLSGVGVAVFVLLILAEPDFGSAMIYFFLWLIMVIVIGIPLQRTLTIFGAMFLIGIVAWFFFFHPYQRERILTFFSTSRDAQGGGYHIAQSLVAVGSGGVFGKGFGSGSQSQLRFLPAAETDFVFSVIAEEFGLAGVTLFLGAWLLFFYRCFLAARTAPDNFGAFLVLAITITFAIQFFMNIAMTVGMFPVTGVTLPLVSYGGSALLTHLILVGIILGVRRHA